MRKSQFTANQLRNAFIELYKQKPIEKISIREISEKADTARGTFYVYYQDIYELLEIIENEMLDGLLMLGTKGRTDLYAVYDFIETNRSVFIALLGPYGRQSFEHKVKAALFNESIQLAKEQRIETEKTAHARAEYTSSAVLGMLKMFLASNDRYTKEEMVELLEDYNRRIENAGKPPTKGKARH